MGGDHERLRSGRVVRLVVEDSAPAYLSSHPVPYCSSRGRIIKAPVCSGAAPLSSLLCQVRGEQMTNADENSAGRDKNPGVVRSGRRTRLGPGRAERAERDADGNRQA
jgi:hypothetical protein